MDNSVEQGPGRHTLDAIAQWLEGAEPNAESMRFIQRHFGSMVTVEELRRVGEKLRNDESFLVHQRQLLAGWRDHVASPEGLSESDAQQLLDQFAANFDHALLYDHDIVASSTHMRRGYTSERDMRMPGTMPCWTLHLTLRGHALFIGDRMERDVRPGDMMLLRPGAVYHYGLHPRAQEWQHLWALFQPRSHWSELLDWASLEPDILYLHLPGDAERVELERLFADLIELGEKKGPYIGELRYNRLEEILIRARSHDAPMERGAIDQRVQRACEYMREHLADKFSVESAAAHCSLSPSRFAHLFKQQLGVAPKAWINNERLRRARKLLLHSDAGVGTIGARVGYDDPSHFTKYFRKSVGCSPREFRRGFRGAS